MFFREIIEQWAEGFQDRDGKILKEFQTSFHSTFWEFYIFQLLKDMGLKDNIDFSKNKPDLFVYRQHFQSGGTRKHRSDYPHYRHRTAKAGRRTRTLRSGR